MQIHGFTPRNTERKDILMMYGNTSAVRITRVLLMLLITLTLAGCGQGRVAAPGNATPVPVATTLSSAARETAPAPNTPSQTRPTQGQVAPPDQQLFRVQIGEPSSIDPLQDMNTSQEAVILQLFAMLTRFDQNLTVVPGVAERWEYNTDQTQITFHLRTSTWSDGQPVTAEDFAYSWRRFLDPRNRAPYVSLLTDVIRGATELNQTAISDATAVEHALTNLGVRALDERTLQVDFVRPTPYFPSIVALGVMAPVRHDIVDQHGERWAEPGTLIGNGPFTLKQWTKGSEMTLAANPTYYAGAPTLQTLVFKFIIDDAIAYANYQADEIDLAGVPPTEIPAVRARFPREIHEGRQLATEFYTLNVTQPPFNDARVRRALALAINRTAITDQLLGGLHTPAYSLIPPGMPGHLTREEAGDAAQVYNPEQARKLLAEAGYPNGQGFPATRVVYNNWAGNDMIVQRIQADLQNTLSITVQLDSRESTTYFNDIQSNPPPFFRGSWVADFPDPVNWDRMVFGPGSSMNFGRWENAEFSRLLTQADQSSDPDQRIALYKQAEQVLAKDAGAVFLYWYGSLWLVKPWVSGITSTAKDPSFGAFFYKDVQILAH